MKKTVVKKAKINEQDKKFKAEALSNARAYARKLTTTTKKKTAFKSVFDSCPMSRLNKAITDLL